MKTILSRLYEIEDKKMALKEEYSDLLSKIAGLKQGIEKAAKDLRDEHHRGPDISILNGYRISYTEEEVDRSTPYRDLTETITITTEYIGKKMISSTFYEDVIELPENKFDDIIDQSANVVMTRRIEEMREVISQNDEIISKKRKKLIELQINYQNAENKLEELKKDKKLSSRFAPIAKATQKKIQAKELELKALATEVEQLENEIRELKTKNLELAKDRYHYVSKKNNKRDADYEQIRNEETRRFRLFRDHLIEIRRLAGVRDQARTDYDSAVQSQEYTEYSARLNQLEKETNKLLQKVKDNDIVLTNEEYRKIKRAKSSEKNEDKLNVTKQLFSIVEKRFGISR